MIKYKCIEDSFKRDIFLLKDNLEVMRVIDTGIIIINLNT